MNTATITLATVPIILAVIQLLKGLGLPNKWAPLLAVLLGVGFSLGDFFTVSTHGDIYPALVYGVTLGLSAAGLYDGAKIAHRSYTRTPRNPVEHYANIEE